MPSTKQLSATAAILLPTVMVETGLVQTDLDVSDPAIIEITTGGTAGEELLNIPLLALDLNGVNPSKVGQRITLYLKTQTNPGDTVKVLVGDSAALASFQSVDAGKPARTSISALVLDFAGSYASFVWNGLTWLFDNLAASGGYCTITWGAAGNELLSCPNGTTTIVGKDVVITGDDGGSGNVKVLNLPTADPTVAGALWNSAGAVKISAG